MCKMAESFDKPTVLRLLSDLARKDRSRTVFGSAAHDYKLNPPIPVSAIEEFETRHRIRLPEDYRYFITEIGNGGADPAYGLFPFGQQDDSVSWEEGDLFGDVSRPFPHVEAWNLPESFFKQEPNVPPDTPSEEEDRLWEEWDKVEHEHYWNPSIMNGAIPICHLGCALRQWLVVNGEQRGFIWNDYRADHGGVVPLRNDSGEQMNFSDWYMSWLNESLRKAGLIGKAVESLRREAVAAVHAPVRLRSRRSELLTLLGLIVAGVLLALLLALLRG